MRESISSTSVLMARLVRPAYKIVAREITDTTEHYLSLV